MGIFVNILFLFLIEQRFQNFWNNIPSEIFHQDCLKTSTKKNI